MCKVAVYVFRSEDQDSLDDIQIKVCFFIPLALCTERIMKLHKRKHMQYLECKTFDVSYNKKKYYFRLSHKDEVDGWCLDSDNSSGINVDSINFFNGKSVWQCQNLGKG